jgi:hypothetical protein
MITNWDSVAWIFDYFSAYCVIYIQEATLDDWEKVITFLNENDSLVFELYNYEDLDPYKTTNQIDREFIFQSFSNHSETDDYAEAHFNLNGLEINCFFEFKDQIELSFQAGSVKSIDDYKTVEALMIKLSTLLNRMVTLAYEGGVIFPLIKVDITRGMIEVVDEKKYENRFYTLKYRIESLYSRFLQIFFPEKNRIMWVKIHEDDHLPKKIKDNEW